MKAVDMSAVHALLVRENPHLTTQQADQAIDALMQWLAGHAVAPHVEPAYVMLFGVVDDAFHAFILNTRAYMKFCKEQVGFFIHHTPVSDSEASELLESGALDYTVDFLLTEFGDTLSPLLHDWYRGVKEGTLGAAAVSCKWGMNIAEDPSILEHFGLVSITRRWTA